MKQRLQEAAKNAMKARDKLRLDTIRSVISAVQYEEIEKKIEQLPEDGILAVIKREIKKRKEQLEFAEKASRAELISQLTTEAAILEEFLPKQLSSTEVEQIIIKLKAENAALNVGMAMKALKEGYAGQYDSKQASELAKKLLS